METFIAYKKRDQKLKAAISKMEQKLQTVNWSETHKLDPNLIYDLVDRLTDRLWDNCSEALTEAWDQQRSYRLEKINNLPVWSVK